MAKKYYADNGRAGIKLLVTAMKRNIERVESRYRNKQTREVCQQMAQLCDGIWEAIDEDRPFTVYLGKQLTLNFSFPDEPSRDEPNSVGFANMTTKDGYTPTLAEQEAAREWLYDYANNEDAYSRIE